MSAKFWWYYANKIKSLLMVTRLLSAGGTGVLINATLLGHYEGHAEILVKQEEAGDEVPSLHDAAMVGDTGGIQELMNMGEDGDQKNEGKYTPLHLAAINGQIDTIHLLLEKGADINARNQYGLTPLGVSLRAGKKASVQTLRERGAKKTGLPCSASTLIALGAVTIGMAGKLCWNAYHSRSTNTLENTPLHAATRHNAGAISVLLDKGANIEAKDKYGNTPLHVAAIFNADAIPMLLQNRANVNAKNKNGDTPLHAAAEYNPAAIPVMLQNGADVNAKNKNEMTPLDVAIRSRKKKDTITLLEAGAELPVRIKNLPENTLNHSPDTIAETLFKLY